MAVSGLEEEPSEAVATLLKPFANKRAAKVRACCVCARRARLCGAGAGMWVCAAVRAHCQAVWAPAVWVCAAVRRARVAV
eukprot:4999908-Prymnesium_polylepis.3